VRRFWLEIRIRPVPGSTVQAFAPAGPRNPGQRRLRHSLASVETITEVVGADVNHCPMDLL